MTSRELAEVALVTVVATLAAAAPAPLELAGFDAKVLAAGDSGDGGGSWGVGGGGGGGGCGVIGSGGSSGDWGGNSWGDRGSSSALVSIASGLLSSFPEVSWYKGEKED